MRPVRIASASKTLCLLLLCVPPVGAGEPRPRPFLSANGKRYVLVESDGAGPGYRLYERARAIAGELPGPGDKLIVTGELPGRPLVLAVLDGKPAFVLLTADGAAPARAMLMGFDSTGKRRWRLHPLSKKSEAALRPRVEADGAFHHGCWLEEEQGRVWYVALDGTIAVVGVADGKPVTLGEEELLDELERIASAGAHAASALHALYAMGEEATPVLFRLLAAGTGDAKLRAGIRAALALRDAETIVDQVARRFGDVEPAEAEDLLLVAIASGVPDLHDRLRNEETQLLELLKQGGATVPWLADHFAFLPTSQAVNPLIRALRRYRRQPKATRRIIAALKPCSGRDYGNDPEAWIRAFRGR